MPVKLVDLSEKLGISLKELKVRAKEAGVEIQSRARSVDDASAAVLMNKLNPEAEPVHAELEAAEIQDTAVVYDEDISQKIEREVIKSQRKQTAGKDTKKKVKKVELPRISEVEIADTISVKEFAEKAGLSPVVIIGELMKNGVIANINQIIDFDTASIIADDRGIKLKRKRAQAAIEDISTGNLEMLLKEQDSADLTVRPPIVTVMGHVDHGKTSLLDAIRKTNVVASESGGITQHIGAYQVEDNGRVITFIDTPGHEAFTDMRARGAKITDIAILVVAADDGVMPQTIEAINHAKDAEVPIIVALNKIDKEDINVDRVKAQLAEQGLQPEDWGGKTIIVPVSAITGQGIPDLLEMILLTSEMLNLKANAHRPAVATVLEGNLDKNLGPVATVLINTGTLKLQDAIVGGLTWGRVKTMVNDRGLPLSEASPAMPVRISGLATPPVVGDILQVVRSVEQARANAEGIRTLRGGDMGGAKTRMLELIAAIKMGKIKTLKIVIKSDTLGSLQAIKQSLLKITHEEVNLKIIHGGVGNITEGDVLMASAAGGVLIGFHVLTPRHVKDVAERRGIEIMTYHVIYELIEDVKKLLSGLLEPEVEEVSLGKAEVKQIFLTEKKYMIVGCRVISGSIEQKTNLKVWRGEKHIGDGFLETLRRAKDQVQKLNEGNECGIKFVGPVAIEPGDVFESSKLVRRQRTIA